MILMSGTVLLWTAHHSMAQDANNAVTPTPLGIATPAVTGAARTPVAPADAAVATAPAMPDTIGNDAINPNDIPSVLFTFWEHTAIADAKNSRGETREVTDDELMRDLNSRGAQKTKPPPEEREIRLGGIVFVDNADWTIWLNDKRVTPGAIPREVMDLKVHKEYIEMKWMDDYTNQIFPIRLRTHQRFNIDSRIFLPG
jgi:hypothetical protein